jgi:hypothetical protein
VDEAGDEDGEGDGLAVAAGFAEGLLLAVEP